MVAVSTCLFHVSFQKQRGSFRIQFSEPTMNQIAKHCGIAPHCWTRIYFPSSGGFATAEAATTAAIKKAEDMYENAKPLTQAYLELRLFDSAGKYNPAKVSAEHYPSPPAITDIATLKCTKLWKDSFQNITTNSLATPQPQMTLYLTSWKAEDQPDMFCFGKSDTYLVSDRVNSASESKGCKFSTLFSGGYKPVHSRCMIVEWDGIKWEQGVEKLALIVAVWVCTGSMACLEGTKFSTEVYAVLGLDARQLVDYVADALLDMPTRDGEMFKELKVWQQTKKKPTEKKAALSHPPALPYTLQLP